jgi:Fe-S oxidoreductase
MSIQVPIYSTLYNEGISPEILFWVGCAGSFDTRAQRVTKAFCTILNKIGVSFAILGEEEKCTGDPARRAGNEFLFQMLALQNIQTLNHYGVKKIVTACPHCFNTHTSEKLRSLTERQKQVILAKERGSNHIGQTEFNNLKNKMEIR